MPRVLVLTHQKDVKVLKKITLQGRTTGPVTVPVIVGRLKKDVQVDYGIYNCFRSNENFYKETSVSCVEVKNCEEQNIATLRSEHGCYDIVVALSFIEQCLGFINPISDTVYVFVENTYGHAQCYLQLKKSELNLIFESDPKELNDEDRKKLKVLKSEVLQ